MHRKETTIFVVAAALILLWQLVLPPAVGVADNGDFAKLIGRYSLGAPDRSAHLSTRYVFDIRYLWPSGFSSSELLLILSMLGVNRVLSKDGAVDLRLMGCIHGALFLAALVLFLPVLDGTVRWRRVVFASVALFMFCDVMYVSYLNSFYMDAAGYLGLLFTVVFYLRALKWGHLADRIFLVASSVFLVTSKPQHAALGVWFALLFALSRDVLWTGRRSVAAAVSALLLVTTWATFELEAPSSQTSVGCFNVVFHLVLPNSKHQAQTLAALGLADSDRQWIGKTAYSAGMNFDDPSTVEYFARKLSYPRLAWFFVTHPSDAVRSLRIALDEAGLERPSYLGNFDAASGQPANSQSRAFALWSGLKRSLFENHGRRLLLWFGGLAAIVITLLRLHHRTLPRGAFSGGIILIAMAVTEMLIASLAEGMEPARHNLLFFAQFDMLLLTAAWLGLRS